MTIETADIRESFRVAWRAWVTQRLDAKEDSKDHKSESVAILEV